MSAAYVLAGRVAALPEIGMRRALFAAEIVTVEPAVLVQILGEIVRRGRSAGPPFEAALLALATALATDTVPYDRLEVLYAEARRTGEIELQELLLSPQPARCAELEPMGLLQRRGRVLTVGERMQAARNTTRTELDRLLRDTDARVIRNLLLNARLVERDVTLLASRRPTTAAIQLEIFLAGRWIARPAVRRALARNPFTPTDMTLRLLSLLPEQDLAEIAQALDLPDAVRQSAARRLRPGRLGIVELEAATQTEADPDLQDPHPATGDDRRREA